MSTGKILLIAGGILAILLILISVCIVQSSSSSDNTSATAVVTASDRLLSVEQRNSDLARLVQSLTQQLTDLQSQLAKQQLEIDRLK